MQTNHILYSILEKTEKIKKSDQEKSLHSQSGMVYFASMSLALIQQTETPTTA